ncbi:hypothetical protein BZA77DRAFT_390318 [Pyronema omphalodes]|nr:hypothetical protein BZA77DRAFT_390318 [Pyronema omphalodes]
MPQLTLHVPDGHKARWAILATILNLALVAIGIYTWTQTASLHLPLPQILPILATFLPLLSLSGIFHGLSKPITSVLARNPLKTAMPAILLLIIDIILLTMSGERINPNSCSFREKWETMYKNHDKAIQGIQDALECCGFRNPHDMPFPFPSKGVTTQVCQAQTGRTRGCAEEWGRREEVAGGLLTVVAGVLAVAKILGLLLLQRATEKERIRKAMVDEQDGRVEEVNTEDEGDEDDEDRPDGRERRASERTPLLHDSPWVSEGVNGADAQRDRVAGNSQ